MRPVPSYLQSRDKNKQSHLNRSKNEAFSKKTNQLGVICVTSDKKYSSFLVSKGKQGFVFAFTPALLNVEAIDEAVEF